MQTVQIQRVVYGPGVLLCAGTTVTLPDSIADPLVNTGSAIRVKSSVPVVLQRADVIETATLIPSPVAEQRGPIERQSHSPRRRR